MAKFNERLRELRLKKNISLEKMAKDLGTTKATLSRYENGLRDPKTEVTKIRRWGFIVPINILFLRPLNLFLPSFSKTTYT